MKKLFVFALFALGITFGTQAQNTVRVGGGGMAYQQGDKIVQVGLGLGRAVGGYNWTYGGGAGLSVNAAVELGVHEYFSVGPYLAFGRYGLGGFAGNRYHITALAAGVRGSFHYVSLLNEIADTNIDEEKLDLYVSVLLGVEFYSYDFDNDPIFDNVNYNSTGFDGGAVVGGRYKFNPRLAVFTELGYAGLSVWTLGVSFHL